MAVRRHLFLTILLCLLVTASFYQGAYAWVDFSIVLEADKSIYGVGDTVNVAGNLTLDGLLVLNGLVAFQVDASNEVMLFRTLNTGTNPPVIPGVHVLNASVGDAFGNPNVNLYRDGATVYYIWIYFNNNHTIPLQALLVITGFDSTDNVICNMNYSKDPITIPVGGPYLWMAPWLVPEDAELGAARIYVNAYTDYPEENGWPHCIEKSYSFNILSRETMSLSSQSGEASHQVTGNFNTTFRIKRFGGRLGNHTIFASAFILVNGTAYLAFDSLTFQVILQGDINHDNWVDIFDVVIVALAFGTSPPTDPRADVNKDGTVDIFDLVVVALHYGEWGIP